MTLKHFSFFPRETLLVVVTTVVLLIYRKKTNKTTNKKNPQQNSIGFKHLFCIMPVSNFFSNRKL